MLSYVPASGFMKSFTKQQQKLRHYPILSKSKPIRICTLYWWRTNIRGLCYCYATRARRYLVSASESWAESWSAQAVINWWFWCWHWPGDTGTVRWWTHWAHQPCHHRDSVILCHLVTFNDWHGQSLKDHWHTAIVKLWQPNELSFVILREHWMT